MSATSPGDFKTLVARQFATRPTLRSVLSQQLLAVLQQTHPLLLTVQPALADAQAILLISPDPLQPSWSSQPLLEVAMRAVFEQQPMDFTPVAGRHYQLSVAAPHRFAHADDSLSYVALGSADVALNALLVELPLWLQQAQIDYWNAQAGAGVSRELWLQGVLQQAVLQNLPLQSLDEAQRRCLRGLLKDGQAAPQAFAVQAQLIDGEHRQVVTLPQLLVVGEADARRLTLWCTPCGVIRAFDTFESLSSTLLAQLAERHRFEHMVWDRYLLEGNVFASQVCLLLESQLQHIAALHWQRFDDIAHMERVLHALTDPAMHFIPGYIQPAPAGIQLPPGLSRAKMADNVAYQSALLQLAVDQQESDGVGALDGIPTLQAFARQRLAQLLTANHGLDAAYDSDDIVLELAIARGVPGGAGVGPGGGESLEALGSKSLTEFAIGNLSALHGAFIKSVTHRTGLPLPQSLDAQAIKRMVTDADVGGRYPRLVAQELDERSVRPARVRRFAREWRNDLAFQALAAKLDNRLSDTGLQVVTDYCLGHVDLQTPGIALIPLAFKRAAASKQRDVVRGAYLLFSAEPAKLLLYCPLFAPPLLREYSSFAELLAAVRTSPTLQKNLLAWMAPEVQDIYGQGGFAEPHIAELGIDPFNLPETPDPANLDIRLWLHQVDEKLYSANRDLLLELAQLHSTSTAQSRWQRLAEGAWLLFNTATLLIRGPIASVAWLIQLLESLDDDLGALGAGSDFERGAAAVDVLLNLGMALLHQHAPPFPGGAMQPPPPPRLLGSSERFGSASGAQATQGKVVLQGPSLLATSQLDMRTRGNQGFNFLTAQNKQALRRMRVNVSLDALQPVASGTRQGLYEVDERLYLAMAGMTFRVGFTEGGIRVFDGDQLTGPWLEFQAGAWRIDRAMRGVGGMPKRRVERLREANAALQESLNSTEASLLREINALVIDFNKHRAFLVKAVEELSSYSGTPGAPAQQILSNIAKQARLRVVADLKSMVDKGFAHDQVVSQIARTGRPALDMQEAIRRQRNATRYDLIERCTVYSRELNVLIAEANLQQLGDAIAVLPESESEKRSYQTFYQQVEAVVGWRTELVDLLARFDRVLEDSLADRLVAFRNEETGERINKEAWLGQIIQERRLTAVDHAFGLLMDLAEASLNRLAAVDEQVLVDYADYLSNPELRSSGSAHGEAAAEPDLKERVEILSGVLQDYKQAEAMSGYLTSLGGEAVRQEPLAAYRRVLKQLIDVAQEDLDQAVRETELAEPRQPRLPVYASRGGRRKVVTTRRGHRVVAEEAEVDGHTVVRQLDFRKAVLKTFHQQDGRWVEDSAALPLTPEPVPETLASVSAARAASLLGQVEKVIGLARQYFKADEPRGLETVIDGHINKLTELSAKLPDQHNESLLERLGDGIDRLHNARDDMLRGLYLSTRHPTAQSLRFLLQHEAVTVSRSQARKATLAGDYLDIYEVRRRAVGAQTQGKGLWEAHFHYPEATTPALAFSKGHLKIWSERKLGREAQMRAAQTRNELLFIYRGDLKADQVSDLFPFE